MELRQKAADPATENAGCVTEQTGFWCSKTEQKTKKASHGDQFGDKMRTLVTLKNSMILFFSFLLHSFCLASLRDWQDFSISPHNLKQNPNRTKWKKLNTGLLEGSHNLNKVSCWSILLAVSWHVALVVLVVHPILCLHVFNFCSSQFLE